MEIRFLGHASFKIKGKRGVVVTDPFDSKTVGLKFPNVEAGIVTISHNHKDHNQAEIVEGSPVVIQGPGEYEIKGIKIYGFSSFHDEVKGEKRGQNTIYLIKVDNINIVHCGDLGHKLTDELIQELGSVDILILPTGGIYTLDAKTAVSVVRQLEPKIVIPMHYKVSAMAPSFDNLASIDEFLKEIGKSNEPQKKLIVTKDKLPEEMEIVILE